MSDDAAWFLVLLLILVFAFKLAALALVIFLIWAVTRK